ncbi:MAG: nucleotidyltransferase family protein [Woeseiaceae bacterium]|nr:nucleotidyltransferase family protein [Gammaproteobacteria bacterium]NNK25592.1 nucleotidyltransferase family protein [Woeseiaceae bacterium]
MKGMVLAAGRGERLRPITDRIPKSLVEVGGQSLLERHLEHLRAAGIREVVINLGWLGDKIVERVGSGQRYGLEVVYSDERGDVLETGGGIFKALPLLGSDPFVVINADIYTEMPVPELTLRDDHQAHLVLVPTPAYREHGDFDLVDGLVRNADEPRFTVSGVSVYRPEFFHGCEAGRFSVAPLWRAAADRGEISGSLYAGPWADIGTPERLESFDP